MNLEPCDILFVKKNKDSGWYGKIAESLVKWATNSQYFHVCYFVRDDVVFEANGNRTAGFAYISDKIEYDVKRLDFPIEVRRQILAEMIKSKGSKYNWGEIISLFLRKKCKINIFYDKKNYYICSSELFDAVEKVTGVRLLDQVTEDVSPEDLWESKYLKSVEN